MTSGERRVTWGPIRCFPWEVRRDGADGIAGLACGRLCLAPACVENTMPTTSSRSLLRLFAGAAAVLSGLLLAPSSARAGCGDYVLIGSKAGPTAHASPSPHPQGMPQQMPSAPHNGHSPCSGPMCSKAPLPLPVAPATVVLERGPEAALAAILPPVSARQPITRWLDGLPGRTVHRGTDVYHPPRLS